MKKGLLTTSLISALIFFIGVVFKKMHWPGASMLLLLGVIVGIVFLILYLINGTKLLKSGMEKTNGIITAITMIIVFIGFTFKSMHWPGGQILLITSNISLLISSILMFIDAFSEVDKAKQSIKGLFAFSYFILMSILIYIAIFF
jgi:hypothetical protein